MNQGETKGEEGALMSFIFPGADGQRQHGDEWSWGGGGGPRRGQREQGAHALHPVAAEEGQAGRVGKEKGRRLRNLFCASVNKCCSTVCVVFVCSQLSYELLIIVVLNSSAILIQCSIMTFLCNTQFPCRSPMDFSVLVWNLINLLCNFRWASCKFQHLA